MMRLARGGWCTMSSSEVLNNVPQTRAGIISPKVFRLSLTPEDLADIKAGRIR